MPGMGGSPGAASVTHWSLYVDESGKLEVDDEVVVAGVLVRQDGPRLESALRGELRKVAPHVPWPPHAGLLWLPTMHALWMDDGARRGHAPAPGFVDLVLQTWRAACPAALDKALAAVQRGGKPNDNTLKELDRHLEPSTVKELRRIIRQIGAGLLEIRSALGGTKKVWLCMAAEATPGDAFPAAGEPGDRYLELLACLFQRVADVVARVGSDHNVQLHVLVRDVTSGGKRRALDVSGLSELASRVAGRIRMEAKVWEFDSRIGPGLVIADQAANLARRPVNRDVPLEDLDPRVRPTPRRGLGRDAAGPPGDLPFDKPGLLHVRDPCSRPAGSPPALHAGE